MHLLYVPEQKVSLKIGFNAPQTVYFRGGTAMLEAIFETIHLPTTVLCFIFSRLEFSTLFYDDLYLYLSSAVHCHLYFLFVFTISAWLV